MSKIGLAIGAAVAAGLGIAGYVVYSRRGAIAESVTQGITNRAVNPLQDWLDALLSSFAGNGQNSGNRSNGPSYVAPNPPPNPRQTNPSYPDYQGRSGTPSPPAPSASGRPMSQSEWAAYNEAEIRRRQNQARVTTPPATITGSTRVAYFGDNPEGAKGAAALRNEAGWTNLLTQRRRYGDPNTADWIRQQTQAVAKDYDWFRVFASYHGRATRNYTIQVK